MKPPPLEYVTHEISHALALMPIPSLLHSLPNRMICEPIAGTSPLWIKCAATMAGPFCDCLLAGAPPDPDQLLAALFDEASISADHMDAARATKQIAELSDKAVSDAISRALSSATTAGAIYRDNRPALQSLAEALSRCNGHLAAYVGDHELAALVAGADPTWRLMTLAD